MLRPILFSCSLLGSAFALQPFDQSAIEKVIQGQADCWNLSQCKGFGDGYTEDADFVNIFGMKFVGKEEIEKRHIQILQTFLKDSKFKIVNTSLREVQPGLVIASVSWRVEGFRSPKMDLSKPGETRDGLFTHVFIQKNGKWEITASQNTMKPNPL